MNILCLNTAFSEAHIALSFSNKNYFEKIDANSKHSENLLVAIENLFEKVIKDGDLESNSHDILKGIDVISVIIGPGSFTGLRISIATAKAILDTNPLMKVITIDSLELIANEYKNKVKITKNITAVIDALSELYFVSEFDKELKCISTPKMINETELKLYKNLISNDESLVEKENFCELTPETLLKITEEKINKGDYITEDELKPLYLRPSQAEAGLKNANKN